MREMTCITCPNGCLLHVEEQGGKITVTGNLCPRGETFAKAELTHPMRTVCTTVRTIFEEVPVIPVRVTREIPRERIFDVMRQINQITVSGQAGIGEVLIQDVLGLGADVIVTSNVLCESGEGGKKHE